MSIKIYNGYTLPYMSLEELYAITQDFKNKINTAAEKLANELVAKMSTTIFDLVTIGEYQDPEKQASFPLAIAMHKIHDRQRKIKSTHQRDPEVDFSCSACIIPSIKYQKIFCLLFSEQKEFTKIWEEIPGLQEYPYWNNTDHPDDMTWEQWEERGKEWTDALGETGIPRDAGFTIECGDALSIPRSEKVLEYIPDFEKRVSKIGLNCVYKKATEEFKQEDPELKNPYRIISQAKNFIKSEAGQSLLQEEKQRISALLKPEITKEDLLKTLV